VGDSGLGQERTPLTDSRGRVNRYRLDRPKAGIVETTAGHFEATEHAERRRGWHGHYLDARDRVLGVTLASNRLESEKLSKVKALAVFSSDAISSVAYATQEILFILLLAGTGAMRYSLPIAIAIVLLLCTVVISYRQTIREYPSGGGAYIVAHENLGVPAGLMAASALLIDYVLTVSVSIAAGMDALASLNGAFRPIAVEMAVGLVGLVALINLRGLKESGTIFAIPTYAFIFTLAAAIAVTLTKILLGGDNPLAAGHPRETVVATQGVTVFLIMRAFANGCTAMTGVEAVSNGVQAFRAPAPENANKTLMAMAMILGSLFLGVTLIARHYGMVPHEDSTIPSQLGAEAFGDGSVLFAFLQVMTAGILVLAANTAFADFPRLAAILARDGYMPRIFHARGNRLVFSYGIVVLASLACLLIVVFSAKTTRLIPLYALGVFIGFTLSQAGMVRHWLKGRKAGWRQRSLVNGLGATATGIVAVVILLAKFREGAWVIAIVMPIIAWLAWIIGRFYQRLQRNLRVASEAVLDLVAGGSSATPVIVPVEEINLAVVMALGAACERSRDVRAVHVRVDPDEPSTVADRWARQFPSIPLVVIDSPFRTVADPIANYVRDLAHLPPYQVEVIVPMIEVRHRYERPLVNQSLRRLKRLLAGHRHIGISTYSFAEGSGGRRRRRAPAI
jgi:amino acid transporter